MQQQGAAAAGGALAQGQAYRGLLDLPARLIGQGIGSGNYVSLFG